MAKKTMSSSVQNRSAAGGKFVSSHGVGAKGKARLADSITGSLRVEGYAVKRETVVKAIENRKK